MTLWGASCHTPEDRVGTCTCSPTWRSAKRTFLGVLFVSKVELKRGTPGIFLLISINIQFWSTLQSVLSWRQTTKMFKQFVLLNGTPQDLVGPKMDMNSHYLLVVVFTVTHIHSVSSATGGHVAGFAVWGFYLLSEANTLPHEERT